MKRQELAAGWKLLWHGREIETQIPCSLYGDLTRCGEIADPYYRDNEAEAFALSREDCTYALTFSADGDLLSCARLLLRLEMIDTLADVWLNGTCVGSACNMHRVWEFPVKGVLHEGTNRLEVRLHAPLPFLEQQVAENGSIPCNGDTVDGFPYLRKSSCMFGWDWGPRLPDMGLTRPVSLLGIDTARLTDVLVRQRHEDGRVFLSFRLHTEGTADGWRVTVTGPDGGSQSWEAPAGEVEIEQPQLWWPRGYGAQPLYTVRVELFCAGEPADVWERRIGLRTMRVHRARDKWGESFAHEANGVCVFAMGADYIPEDCLLGRVTPSRTRHLLEQAALANFNTVRVWGGGYYPDDAFYDACDELGLLVWQDLMFACATYRLTESFEANITREIGASATTPAWRSGAGTTRWKAFSMTVTAKRRSSRAITRACTAM